MEKGINQLVHTCLKIKNSDKVVIVTDNKTRHISEKIREKIEEITNNIEFFVLEDFGKRPLKKLPEDIKNSLKNANISLYAAASVEGELAAVRKPLLELVFNRIKHAHLPNFNEEMIKTGMATDHRKVQEITDRLFSLLKKARKITVTTEKGTKLEAEFDKKYKWAKSNAILAEKEWTNLPGAEVFGYPDSISGVVVIDDTLGDFFVKYGNLEKSPVFIYIKDNKVIKVECKDKSLEKELKHELSKKNANIVGEFAFGTNIFLKKSIGVLLQDEKMPTIHIAFGDPYPKLTNAPYESDVHIDAVMKNALVFIDGKKILENGHYFL